MIEKRKKVYFTAVSIILVLIVAFGILEIVSRFAYQSNKAYRQLIDTAERAKTSSVWMASPDPELIYVHRPNYWKNGIRVTEAHGLLHPEDVPEQAEPEVFRIALVGDSIVAALDMPYEERFSSQLQVFLNDALQEQPDRVEVLNFAVNGYRTIQEARLVETFVSLFDPDVILIQYCMNDPGNSYTPTIWFTYQPPTCYLLHYIKQSLHLYPQYNPQDSLYVPTFGPGYGTSQYWYNLYRPDSKSWESVRQGFSRIDAYARRQNIPVALVIFPFLLDDPDAYQEALPFHQQVRNTVEQSDWILVDLFDLFAQYSIASLKQAQGDIYHPNVQGHALAARTVGETLRKRVY